MKLTAANINALYTGFNLRFQEGINAAGAGSAWEKYAMVLPSATAMETYAWLLLTSTMRKWVGPRVVNAMDKQSAVLVNEDFEHTIGVKRNDIEDDKLGIYSPMFTQMGVDAGRLWHRLAATALLTNDKWIDGADFFTSTRKYEKSTINNKVDAALGFDSFVAAKTLMGGYCAANGEPMEVVPTHLVVGPSLESTGLEILKNDYRLVEGNKGAAAVRNVQANTCELVVDRRITGAAASSWFLMACGGAVKPVAVQKRKVGALVRWDTDQDACVKDRNQNEYGIHYRGAAAKTLPHLVIGGNL